MSPAHLVEKPSEVKLGHGQRGYVRMACEIPLVTRDALVEIAQRENRTLKSVYLAAFELYLRQHV